MKNPLRALFKPKPVTSRFKSSDAPSTLQAGSEAANRQQLVLITLRDQLRRSGVPAHWLECQTLLVTSRSRGTGLYVHLVVRHWDERLVRFMQAFQTELRDRIVRFDPKAASWVHGIAWDFDAMDSCPYPELPPKSTWEGHQETLMPGATDGVNTAETSAHFPAVLALVPSATLDVTAKSEVEQDLAALFAIRDEEIGAAALSTPLSGVRAARTFEATEPAPLH